MKKEDKGIIIEQLQAVLGEYSHFYLTNIEGLNAEQTSNLRRQCFKNDIKLIVAKNTLLKKALEKKGIDRLCLKPFPFYTDRIASKYTTSDGQMKEAHHKCTQGTR